MQRSSSTLQHQHCTAFVHHHEPLVLFRGLHCMPASEPANRYPPWQHHLTCRCLDKSVAWHHILPADVISWCVSSDDIAKNSQLVTSRPVCCCLQ